MFTKGDFVDNVCMSNTQRRTYQRPCEVMSIVAQGTQKARNKVTETMSKIKATMGINYRLK